MRTSLLRKVAMSCLPHTRNICHEWQNISNMFHLIFVVHDTSDKNPEYFPRTLGFLSHVIGHE